MTLPSWTHPLDLSLAGLLIEAGEPGLTIPEWHQRAHALLHQSKLDRRNIVIRTVREHLLDHREGVLLDTPFLRLFLEGSPARRHDLLVGRYLHGEPWVSLALDTLVAPALAAADRPLAPNDSDLVSGSAWDAFVLATLPPGTGRPSADRTRQSLQAALREAGVLLVTGGHRRETRVHRTRPDPLAFAWLVAKELGDGSRGEVPEPWAQRDSFAARLFAPPTEYAAVCIDAGVDRGVLRRGLVMGRALLRPAGGLV